MAFDGEALKVSSDGGHSHPRACFCTVGRAAALVMLGLWLAAAPGWAAPPALVSLPAPVLVPVPTQSSSWLDLVLAPFKSLSYWIISLFSHEERFVADDIQAFKHDIDTDLTSFDTLVQQAGFDIGEISVGASLVPEVSLTLEFHHRLSDPEKAALLAKINDPSSLVGTVERRIITILLNAAESVYAIRGDGYQLSEVEIDLDIIPDVRFVINKTP